MNLLFWGGSKITADGDCSHEIKRHLLLERKTIFYIKARQHIKKQRHSFANKWGSNGNRDRLFGGTLKSLQMVTATMKLKNICFLEEKL